MSDEPVWQLDVSVNDEAAAVAHHVRIQPGPYGIHLVLLNSTGGSVAEVMLDLFSNEMWMRAWDHAALATGPIESVPILHDIRAEIQKSLTQKET